MNPPQSFIETSQALLAEQVDRAPITVSPSHQQGTLVFGADGRLQIVPATVAAAAEVPDLVESGTDDSATSMPDQSATEISTTSPTATTAEDTSTSTGTSSSTARSATPSAVSTAMTTASATSAETSSDSSTSSTSPTSASDPITSPQTSSTDTPTSTDTASSTASSIISSIASTSSEATSTVTMSATATKTIAAASSSPSPDPKFTQSPLFFIMMILVAFVVIASLATSLSFIWRWRTAKQEQNIGNGEDSEDELTDVPPAWGSGGEKRRSSMDIFDPNKPMSRRSSLIDDPSFAAEKRLRQRSVEMAASPATPFLHSAPTVSRPILPPVRSVPLMFGASMGAESVFEPGNLTAGAPLQIHNASASDFVDSGLGGLGMIRHEQVTVVGTPREEQAGFQPRYMGVESSGLAAPAWVAPGSSVMHSQPVLEPPLVQEQPSTLSRASTMLSRLSYGHLEPAGPTEPVPSTFDAVNRIERGTGMSQLGWAATLRTNLLTAITAMTRSNTQQSMDSFTAPWPIFNRPAHLMPTPYADHATDYERPSKGIKLYAHRTSAKYVSSSSGTASEGEDRDFQVKIEDPRTKSRSGAISPRMDMSRDCSASSATGWSNHSGERALPVLARSGSTDSTSDYSSATGTSLADNARRAPREGKLEMPVITVASIPKTAKPSAAVKVKQVKRGRPILATQQEDSSAGSEAESGDYGGSWFARNRAGPRHVAV